MAHFAEIKNNIVERVIVVSNDNCGGGTFPESEVVGQEFLASLGLTITFVEHTLVSDLLLMAQTLFVRHR